MSLFQELKRRNVFRVGIAYIVVGWLVTQVLEVVLESFGSPDWVMKTVLVILAAGLPFALIFAWAFEMTPEGIKKEKDVDRSQSITQHTGRKLDYTIIAILVIALGYFAYDKFVVVPARNEQAALLAEEAEASPSEKSIAVLPFVNMSDDAGNEYFSDGISEEILNALAKVKELKVAGRTSSFAFKGQNQDLRQIGDTLGVEHILEGSVRKYGNQVRITAQLIQVDDGFHLWSESYDRELDNVFAIQDEIANAILVQLKAQLIGDEGQMVTATRTTSEAYDFYLLAKQRIYERSRLPLESAAELLDKAMALDPDYAPAFAQRGIAAILLSDQDYGTIPLDQALVQGKLYIDKALLLDPQLAEAWAGLGLYYLQQPGQLEPATEALRKALALNPNLIDASNWLQNSLGWAGRVDESVAILEDMMDRDPLYRSGINNLSVRYDAMGQTDKTLAMIERVRPFLREDPLLMRVEANVHFARGELADGITLAAAALEIDPAVYSNLETLSWGLVLSQQFERAAAEGTYWARVNSLSYLDRTEEASILAYERANSGRDVETLFWFLSQTGRYEEMVRFLESRWPDLDAFEAEFPPNGRGSELNMGHLALAYAHSGNEAAFTAAMERYRAALDEAHALGIDNPWMNFSEAMYAALSGEESTALVQLGAAVENGWIDYQRIGVAWPAFKPLEGNPQYEAIQAQMLENINRERGKLGLEPVTT